MKLSTGILTLLLTYSASAAFTTPSNKVNVVKTSLSSTLGDVSASTASVDPLSDVKYETEVSVDQKFKVADIDPKVNDPKFRVQT